ncbi:MAG: imidazolonepropionase [Myxococcota bacterium]|nr:imidazolonepropionase [Myxococcota bacterium]
MPLASDPRYAWDTMQCDLLVHDLSRLYTLDPSQAGLGELRQVSIGFLDGALAYLGPSSEAPAADEVLDGRGLLGLPGLVDCHTHAVWAGSRADEFALRLSGVDYSEILEGGGGILSTVEATRSADRETLVSTTTARLSGLRARGVTTVEVKSGYGLNPAAEAKLLRAAKACESTVRIHPTFLGAHTVPAEFRGDRAAYVRQIIEEQLPLVCGDPALARHVDVYCDRGAFTLDESMSILEAGQRMGLAVRAHAEQVTFTGIAAAAAQLGATCVDHLERLDDAGVATLAEHGTVAVLLPGAQLYLRDSSPPVAALREAGVPMAVASDLNPGSSPVHDLWACATLACVNQGLTIDEAVLGITRNAGRALGRVDLGWIGPDSVADLAVFAPPPGEPPSVESLVQHLAGHHARIVVRDGRRVL